MSNKRREFLKKAGTGLIGVTGLGLTSCHEYLADPFEDDGMVDVDDKIKRVKKVSTSWMAPHRLDQNQWRLYLDWLVEHKFHGTAFSVAPPIRRLNENPLGMPIFGNIDAPNLALINHIDWMIEEAGSKGIKIHLVAFWANPHIEFVTEQSLYNYCLWLGNRYGQNSNVEVIVIGGDWINFEGKVQEVDNYPKYDQMLAGLKDAGISQKIYHHNGSGNGHLADREDLDGWYTQLGHGFVLNDPDFTHSILESAWRKNEEKECHVGEAGYLGLKFDTMERGINKEDILISLQATLDWYRIYYEKSGTIYHVNGISEHWQCYTSQTKTVGFPKFFAEPGNEMTFEESLDFDYYAEVETETNTLIEEFNDLYTLG